MSYLIFLFILIIPTLHLCLGIPEGKILKVVLDVKTRWNSIYYMIERFLDLYQMLVSILLVKTNAPDILTVRELQDIKECKNLLCPLEDLTKKLSGEKYAVISTILPLINCVQDATLHIEVNSNIGIDLKANILYELHKRFKDLEIFNDFPISTLLDPRLVFHKKFFVFIFLIVMIPDLKIFILMIL